MGRYVSSPDADKAALIAIIAGATDLLTTNAASDQAIIWARALQHLLGDRAEMIGFDFDDNPTAHVAVLAGGHDFLLVDDDRFLVDGWLLRDGNNPADRVVFDLYDSDDARLADRLYGDRDAWRLSDAPIPSFSDDEDRPRPMQL